MGQPDAAQRRALDQAYLCVAHCGCVVAFRAVYQRRSRGVQALLSRAKWRLSSDVDRRCWWESTCFSRRLMHIDPGQTRKVSARIASHINPFAKGDMAMNLDLETFLVALYVIVNDPQHVGSPDASCAKVAAYNLGIMINRLLGRPDFAFATLIV